MKRIFSLSLAALVFGLCFLHQSAFAKDDWLQVRSKNFNLIGNASEKDIRRVATRLEQFRDVLSKVLNRANFNSPIPTTVIVFKSDAAYTPYKPVKANGKADKFIAGYFLPGEDVNYITMPINGGDKEDFDTIFHEYTHFIVDNNIGRTSVPPWFNEGLAEYYASFKIEDDQKATLGAIQQGRLDTLLHSKFIPFDTFFNISSESLHENSDDGVGVFYAQAWALMHYFLNGNNGARKPQMNKFLELVTKNRAPKEAFAEAFQTDYATMEKELRNYIGQRAFTTSVLTFKQKLTFDTEMQTAPLSEAESRAYLGDLLYHGNRYPEAEAHLNQALALNPDLPQALVSLGLVKMRQRKFADAKQYLEKAVQTDAKNYLAFYNYAFVLSREGMDENDFVTSYNKETVEKIRAALKKSIELNPKFAEAYHLYAFVSIVQNEQIDEALGYMRQALALAPGNQYYLLLLAQLDSHKGIFAEAKQLAQKVFDAAADSSVKAYAQSTLHSIEQEEDYAAKLKEFQASGGKVVHNFEIVTDKPLSEEELAAQRKKLMNQSINEALRKTAANERRVLGFLTKIQCGKGGITYQFKAENQLMTFTSKDFSSLDLMSFNDKFNGEAVGCDGLKSEAFALLTYRPAAAANAKTAGEVVAIELLPDGFTLEN